MNFRRADEVYDFLDSEVSWRCLEISSLKTSLAAAKGVHYRAIVRAGVPILYAHWEGFVKAASEAYLNFVNNQRHKYNELRACFVVLGLKSKLSLLTESKKSEKNVGCIEFIRKELDQTAVLKLDNAIRTDSNLNSLVFENIAATIGLDTSWYVPKYPLIDVQLLMARNGIAHGEYLDIRQKEFTDLSDEVLILIRNYKADIENSIAQGLYKI